MRVTRSPASLIVLGAALCACSRSSASPRGPVVPVHVRSAVTASVPQWVTSVGNIGPGASPAVEAPAAGRILSVAVGPGTAVAPHTILVRGIGARTGSGPRSHWRVRAPAAAVVRSIAVHVGQTVGRGQGLMTLAGPGIRAARAPFPITKAALLAVGMPVLIHSPLAPRAPLVGRITALHPHPAHGAVYALIALPGRPGFTPGSPVRIDVQIGNRRAIVVPRRAVLLKRAGAVVFTVAGHTVREQRVRRVVLWGRKAVIGAGLAAGALVVTRGQSGLTGGDRVRIVGREPAS